MRFYEDPDFAKTDSVVQPDISVICDLSKLDDKGCWGAPDLIVEILSPGNSRMKLQNKFELYQEYGVREYWVVHPSECTLLVYTLVEGKFQPSKLFTSGDKIHSSVIPGFERDFLIVKKINLNCYPGKTNMCILKNTTYEVPFLRIQLGLNQFVGALNAPLILLIA